MPISLYILPRKITRRRSVVVRPGGSNDANNADCDVSASTPVKCNGPEAEAKFGPIADDPRFYGAIRPPANGGELLRNLKWAVDHDITLRTDFYTPENMTRFFGVEALIIRRLNGRIMASRVVRPTKAALEKLEPNFRSSAKCDFNVDRVEELDHTVGAAILIYCNYKRSDMPTFEEVVQIFGSEWQSGWRALGPPLHGPPPPAIAPHGNQVMVYEFSGRGDAHDREPLKRSVIVRFAPDASFEAFDFNQEGR